MSVHAAEIAAIFQHLTIIGISPGVPPIESFSDNIAALRTHVSELRIRQYLDDTVISYSTPSFEPALGELVASPINITVRGKFPLRRDDQPPAEYEGVPVWDPFQAESQYRHLPQIADLDWLTSPVGHVEFALLYQDLWWIRAPCAFCDHTLFVLRWILVSPSDLPRAAPSDWVDQSVQFFRELWRLQTPWTVYQETFKGKRHTVLERLTSDPSLAADIYAFSAYLVGQLCLWHTPETPNVLAHTIEFTNWWPSLWKITDVDQFTTTHHYERPGICQSSEVDRLVGDHCELRDRDRQH